MSASAVPFTLEIGAEARAIDLDVPYVVEVYALLDTDTVDEAVRQAGTLSLQQIDAAASDIYAVLDLKAPLDSPALTGVPTAPTAVAGTNSGAIANTAFVFGALAALIGGAPGALNTLKELADAIGDDPNYATTVAGLLALKAPLASPALTGTPTAPTAPRGTNTAQIASTGFVGDAIAALINAAPGALDTLRELADAIGDDANFAGTVTNALALKAPLASPALTGTPTSTTPATTDAGNRIATVGTILAAVAALVNGAPDALNTLAEIASAIGNDPSFAATVMAALNTKAPAVRKVQAAGLATGGGDLTADRTITVPKAPPADAIAGTNDTEAVTPLGLAAVLTDLFTTPNRLASYLPTTPPAQPGVPWLDGGVVAISQS